MIKQQLQLANHMKVRLTYQAMRPHTEAALTLQRLGVKAPFTEELRILVPSQQAFSGLDAYLSAFTRLQMEGVVPNDALLIAYDFEDQNDTILAYVIDPGPFGPGSVVHGC